MQAVLVGLSGAVSAAVIDTVLNQTTLSGSPILMAGVRVGAGLGAAFVADKAGAPGAVSLGIAAGPILVTGLDLGTRLIGVKAVEPPPAGSPAQLGAPWAPRLV